MENPTVAAYITDLQDENYIVRWNASIVLGKIGEASAVPALCAALKDEVGYVRACVAEVLGQIGDPSAVPALGEALNDEAVDCRRSSAKALPALCDALQDKGNDFRESAAAALGEIGDSNTLPRKILAYSRWSPQMRINTLDVLRRARYLNENGIERYTFASTRRLCETVLKEEDADGRKCAQAVLNWLHRDRHLLHAE
jgi:HEAT repeat protein